MKTQMFSSLGFGLLVALATPACVVHGSGGMTVHSDADVDVVQEPPAPRVEAPPPRSGFVFVRGRWNWSGNQWVWMDGRWERERANMMWSEGRWEKRGTSWHWIEGTWGASGGVVVTDHREGPAPQGGVEVRDHREGPAPQGGVEVRDHREPVVVVQPAPPAIRVEAHENGRAGFVWVSGHWAWAGGKYEWMTGRWEREKANKRYVEGRWELRGNAWVFTDGTWEDAPAGPTVRDHRH